MNVRLRCPILGAPLILLALGCSSSDSDSHQVDGVREDSSVPHSRGSDDSGARGGGSAVGLVDNMGTGDASGSTTTDPLPVLDGAFDSGGGHVDATQLADAAKDALFHDASTGDALDEAPATTPGWTKVFDDEFDAFDTSKWEDTYYWGDGAITNAPQCYQSRKNVSVQGGTLKLAVKRGSETSAPYSGAVVETYNRHYQTYGYFELRAMLPAGDGIGPWALLYAEDKSWPPEVDIFELPGGASADKKSLWFTTHYGNQQSKGKEWTSPVRLDEGFHTYGLLWQPNLLVWYVDGTERFRTDVGVPTVDCYFQMGVVAGGGGAWDGDPSGTTLPKSMAVDWVRIWKSDGVRLTIPE